MRQPIEKGERAVFLRFGPNVPRREDSATLVFLGLATGGDIMEWSSQVALVTGSSRGIGRATAQLLAQRGAAVCVNYAAEADAAEALVAGIAKSGGRAIAVKADVTDTAAVQAMVTQTESELGPVTILVNNAGISWQGTLDTYSPEQVARMRAINVEGLIHTMRAVIASMRARHYGRIVNVSSVAAIGTALPGNAFYAATKAEVIVLTRRFALELGPHGITVNAVAPGFVRTDMTQRGRGASDWTGTEQRLAARAMMGRIGEPADIANAVVFLASPASGWITAQTLTVDGGRMDFIAHA
jgi:NAD(P)-dependent dehydrogenase (short-subunit alcohol dehydrogenase family)